MNSEKQTKILENLCLPNNLIPSLRWETLSAYYILDSITKKVYKVTKNSPRSNISYDPTANSMASNYIIKDTKCNKYYCLSPNNIGWSFYECGPYSLVENAVLIPCTPSNNQEDWDEFQDDISLKYWVNRKSGVITYINVKNKPELSSTPLLFFYYYEDRKLCYCFYNITNGEAILYEKDKIKAEDFLTKCYNAKYAQDIIKSLETNKTNVQSNNEDLPVEADPKLVESNKIYSDKLAGVLKEYYGLDAIKAWRNAILSGQGNVFPEIKSNKVIQIWEKLMDLSKLAYQRVTSYVADYIRVLEDQNDLKFYLTVIIPEFCLYPKSFWKSLTHDFYFCSAIGKKEDEIYNFDRYLAVSSKNIMYLQTNFHCWVYNNVVNKVDPKTEEDENWKSFNPPDFQYQKQAKLPKGIKGFLTPASITSIKDDKAQIFAGLMRDPKILLNHSDLIIKKKANYIKKSVERLDPSGINSAWWESLSSYLDIMELALGASFNIYCQENES